MPSTVLAAGDTALTRGRGVQGDLELEGVGLLNKLLREGLTEKV